MHRTMAGGTVSAHRTRGVGPRAEAPEFHHALAEAQVGQDASHVLGHAGQKADNHFGRAIERHRHSRTTKGAELLVADGSTEEALALLARIPS